MGKNLVHKCESCQFGETEFKVFKRPLYARSEKTVQITRMTTFCNNSYTYKQHLVSKCSDYKPSSDKIQRIGKKRFKQQCLIV